MQRVIETVRQHAAATADLEEAVAERDRLIRVAIEAKISYPRIARVTELSEQRLSQVRRGART